MRTKRHFIEIRTIDDLERHFQLFCENYNSGNESTREKDQEKLDELMYDFKDLIRSDSDFCKKHYPNLTTFVLGSIKRKKGSIDNIKTIKNHLEQVQEFIDNAKAVPSTEIKTLRRLRDEYYRYLNPETYFTDPKVIDYLIGNKEVAQYCFDTVNNVLTNNPSNTNTPTDEPVKDKTSQIVPITLDLGAREIIYLFLTLINEKLLSETKNPHVWDLVAKYFTDKNGKPLQNIHQNKDGLKNTKTGKPRRNADLIEHTVKTVVNLNPLE